MTLLTRYTALNVLFVITCIPVVAIGPALTALHSTVFAYNDHEDINLHREYLKRFKREFLPGLLSSIIFLVLATLIIFGFAWITYAKSLVLLRAFDKFSDPNKAQEQPTYVNSSASL